jgi:homoserine acetyltransferase
MISPKRLHSASSSNSKTQPRFGFRRFTIKDMVESQHRLLTEVLGITQLHAVMGISMGGMQAIEWAAKRSRRRWRPARPRRRSTGTTGIASSRPCSLTTLPFLAQ